MMTDYLTIHQQLLLSLECDNINIFFQEIENIFNKYYGINQVIVANINYQQLLNIIFISETIRDSQKFLQLEINDYFKNNHEQENCDHVHLFSIKLFSIKLVYQSQYLGWLLVSDYGKKKQNFDPQFIEIIKKYTSLFIYHQDIKNKEKKIRQIQQNQSEYLSKMNHELRSPIASVIGFAKMLRQQLYGELNPKQLQYVNAIYEAGSYLLELINDLLDIAKLDAQKEELFIEKFLVRELCESCLSLVKIRTSEANLQLNLSIAEDVKYLEADKRKVKQILVNLLTNAIKFTDKGSVTLKVIIENKLIKFQVIDTGIGIKLTDQKKLFQPFTQIVNHLQPQQKGTGLGLMISRELARLHGGDITLVSQECQGSCFTLSLPNK